MCMGWDLLTDFSHTSEMFDDTKIRSRLYPFFHIALFNDFVSFALCTRDKLFESALLDRFTIVVCCGVSSEGTVVVEISYYDVRLVSLSQSRSRNSLGGGLNMNSEQFVQ